MSSLTLPVEAESNLSIQAHVVSQTPGRIRLRVAPTYYQKDKIASLLAGLNQNVAIYRVKANVYASSITIFYEQEKLNYEDIRHILQNLSIIVSKIPFKKFSSPVGSSDAAFAVKRIASNLNQDVKRLTKGAIDLRFLFSLSLMVLALRQLLIKGLQLEAIPWYVLAWYGFDSFIKLHGLEENRRE